MLPARNSRLSRIYVNLKKSLSNSSFIRTVAGSPFIFPKHRFLHLSPAVKLLFGKHVFTGGAGASTVRLLPALCLTRELADRFLDAFDATLRGK